MLAYKECEFCQGQCIPETHKWDTAALEPITNTTTKKKDKVVLAPILEIINNSDGGEALSDNTGENFVAAVLGDTTQPASANPPPAGPAIGQHALGSNPLNAFNQQARDWRSQAAGDPTVISTLSSLSDDHLATVGHLLGIRWTEPITRPNLNEAIIAILGNVKDCDQCSESDFGQCNHRTHTFFLQELDAARLPPPPTPATPQSGISSPSPSLQDTPTPLEFMDRDMTTPGRTFLCSRSQLCKLGTRYGLVDDNAMVPTIAHALLIAALRAAMTRCAASCTGCKGPCSPDRHVVDPATLSPFVAHPIAPAPPSTRVSAIPTVHGILRQHNVHYVHNYSVHPFEHDRGPQ
jgi:hypothetical protein